jgi:hypothetical protein
MSLKPSQGWLGQGFVLVYTGLRYAERTSLRISASEQSDDHTFNIHNDAPVATKQVSTSSNKECTLNHQQYNRRLK